MNDVLKRRQNTAEKVPQGTPRRSKGFKYLTTPEKARRVKRLSKDLKSEKEANKRLRNNLAALLGKESVVIDKDLSSDLKRIIEAVQDSDQLTDMQKIFIQEQLKAAGVKKACGMRWHPAMIRFALSIRMKSPAAYEELSGALKLPSDRMFFDYSHAVAAAGTFEEYFLRGGEGRES